MTDLAWKVIGIAMCILPCIFAGIFIAKATMSACDAVARQPEAGGRVMTITIFGLALAEATAIYGLLMAIMLYTTL